MTTAVQLNFSRHVMEERLERMAYIATTIGFGTKVLYEREADGGIIFQLTDTGVMLLKSPVDDKIITVMVASYDDAMFITEANMSQAIKCVVKANVKRGIVKAAKALKC